MVCADRRSGIKSLTWLLRRECPAQAANLPYSDGVAVLWGIFPSVTSTRNDSASLWASEATMSHKLETMREFKTRNFKVVCDALEETDLDLSFDDDGSVREGLESGELIAFVARVRVFYQGNEVGADYLGGCIYRSFDDFMDHRECGKQNAKYERQEKRKGLEKGSLGRCGSYFHDTIREAIGEARKTIASYKDVRVRSVA